MRALITGSTGFVGSALVARLLRDKTETVVALAHDLPAAHVPFDGAAVAFGDIRDTELIYRLLVDYHIDTIFHLAAQASVSRCKQNPATAWSVNLWGTVSVLDAAKHYVASAPGNLQAIVVASTDKVYGNGPVPYKEGQPLQGVGIYSSTKVAADVAARSYADEFGLPVRVVRSCNVYGPGDQDMTRLIPGSIYKMLHGQKATLYGQDLIREFIYIDDEIEAYLRIAAECQYITPDENVYNICSSGPIHVSAVMRTLAEKCDGEFDVIEGAGFREIKEQWMNGDRLYSLGWLPIVPTWIGLDRTVQWWKAEVIHAVA